MLILRLLMLSFYFTHIQFLLTQFIIVFTHDIFVY